MPKLLTYREIERIYGLKKNTMTKKFRAGKFITSVKVGNRNYFEVSKIEDWIKSNSIDMGS
ncbi:helix-turn-helix domain-containing protein [Sulfuricurvum sp.]|uniref:helix-turn-helix transcriptional regulator n=1 Tax=Sulfuricurvum sp. TaxID=2025608 RepID=UPI002D2CC734|nr:helix-turn-helix domain-containing protein [Sulfuricurvum sp.]HZF70101.1 helix-turn-helix domain-containing protein [Sulfuricurvum sp.]